VLNRYGRNVFRLEVPQRNLLDAARERLRLMVSLRKERPAMATGRLRPVGRLLRDFEYALLTGNDDEARALIGQLKSEGHLAATNILFLEVRRLAASHHWDAIMALPELDGLISMPRPKRVTEALVQAIYETRLRDASVPAGLTKLSRDFVPRSTRVSKICISHAPPSGSGRRREFHSGCRHSGASPVGLVSEVLGKWSPATPEGAYLAALAQFVPVARRNS
jgi:hypothetical protein